MCRTMGYRSALSGRGVPTQAAACSALDSPSRWQRRRRSQCLLGQTQSGRIKRTRSMDSGDDCETTSICLKH